jgi:hypothetical protein
MKSGVAILVAAVLAAPAAEARPEAEAPNPELVFAYDALCVLPDAEAGWRPCRGITRDALSYQDFYRVAGRQDLVAADERRWFRRQVRLATGTGAIVVGAASLVPRLFGRSIAPIWVSAGVIAGGIGLCVWGAQVSQQPLVGPAESADMARTYNDRLREHLGLPPLDARQLAVGIGYRRAF